jgi:hypothetical protein
LNFRIKKQEESESRNLARSFMKDDSSLSPLAYKDHKDPKDIYNSIAFVRKSANYDFSKMPKRTCGVSFTGDETEKGRKWLSSKQILAKTKLKNGEQPTFYNIDGALSKTKLRTNSPLFSIGTEKTIGREEDDFEKSAFGTKK